MVAPSMSKFFKKNFLKVRPEITSGLCPCCELPTSFISIVSDFYRCMNCGEEVKQYVNGAIRYLPIGSDNLRKEEHGP